MPGMSDVQQGPDWWLASDGKWYPPPAPQVLTPTYTPYDYGPGTRRGPVRQTTNGWAIASLCVSILWIGVGSLLGIFFGYKARRELNARRGLQKGYGLATAGIVIGWIGLIIVAFVIIALAFSGDTTSSRGY
jgi:hypothetical protein